MKSDKFEIRLSGSGGQGLILGGIVLGEAATIHDGVNATQTQSYGPEARGGASKSEVIISKNEIMFPKLENINVMVALNQKSCDSYVDDLRADGILITDSTMVKNLPVDVENIYSLPMAKTAREEFGNIIVLNMMSLGAVQALTGCVSKKALIKAIRNRVPRGTEDLNEKAARKGMELALEHKKK
ncbi:MAG: 2-oxoacid:acceptor oxidoreductase family protein [Candidatus Muiribacteriota bacterium]